MSTVTLSIGPKTYTVACADGEEAHIRALGALIAEKYVQLGPARAPLEAQNLVFAALFLADELDQAKKHIAAIPEPDTTEVDALRESVARLERELAAARDSISSAQAEASAAQDEAVAARGAAAAAQAQADTARQEAAAARDAAAVAAARAAAPPPLTAPTPQFDLFGGRPASAAEEEELAARLEALAARAEASAAVLEAAASGA
jgi:cell division protein ZapA